jgi:ribosomal protein S21
MVEVTKKEGESPNALMYRFTKLVKQSGVLREAKKRRFAKRPINKSKIRLSALHREKKRQERARAKKMGNF